MLITDKEIKKVRELDRKGDYKGVSSHLYPVVARAANRLEVTDSLISEAIVLYSWSFLRTTITGRNVICELLFKALEFYKKLEEPEGISEVYNALGYLYQRKGEYKVSASYFKRSIEQNTANSSHSRIRAYNYLACSLIQLKQFKEAIEALLVIEPYVTACRDNNLIAWFYHQFFYVLYCSGKGVEGESYLLSSVRHFENTANFLFHATAENSLACLYEKKGEIKEALLHVEKGINLARKAGSSDFEARFLDTKAQILLSGGSPQSALETVKKSISLLKKGEDYASLVESYETNSRIFLALGKEADAFRAFEFACNITAKLSGQEKADLLLQKFDEMLLENRSVTKQLSSKQTREKLLAVADKIEFKPNKRKVELPSKLSDGNYILGTVLTDKLTLKGLVRNSKILINKASEITDGMLCVIREKNTKFYHTGFIKFFTEFGFIHIDFKNKSNADPLVFDLENIELIGEVVGFCPPDEIDANSPAAIKMRAWKSPA